MSAITNFSFHFRPFCHFFHPFSSISSSINAAIQSKTYQDIPNILVSSKSILQNPNPFSVLSDFPLTQRTQIIDEILQSFIPIRPRTRPQIAYSTLLSYTLQNPNPLPISLIILQRTLRSGCAPPPQTHLLLTNAYLERLNESRSVSNVLLEMNSFGYNPDTGTCNYLVLSLCKLDLLNEGVRVLREMGGAGCFPDSDSFGVVIGTFCEVGRAKEGVGLLKEMVVKLGLAPRGETMLKVVKGIMREKGGVWRAVETVEFLEGEGVGVGFEVYEAAVRGCLECREFVLAGKVVVGMTGKGFIPCIGVRQRVVEGLASAGEWAFACAVRERLAELKS